jgi:hypothetical protein
MAFPLKIIVGLFLLCPLVLFAQKTGLRNTSIGLQAHYGSFITSLPRASYIKDSYTYFGELDFIRQTDGSKNWHVANGLPKWGIGIFFGNSGSKQYIGAIGGIFTFVDFKLIRSKNFTSSLRAGAGAGFIEKPYDAATNHKNLLLSTRLNCFLNLLWKNEFRITDHVFINGGLSFSHLSNARVKLPNLGLNTPAFSAGVRYAFGKTETIKRKADAVNKKIQFQLTTALGLKQIPTIGSNYYLVNFSTVEATRQFSPSGKYGAGIMLSYDRSAGDHYADPLLQSKEIVKHRFNAAAFVSYERLLGKFSLPIQVGVYLLEQPLSVPLYENFGVRYHFDQHWSGTISLKTHFGRADYMHVGIGYQF